MDRESALARRVPSRGEGERGTIDANTAADEEYQDE